MLKVDDRAKQSSLNHVLMYSMSLFLSTLINIFRVADSHLHRTMGSLYKKEKVGMIRKYYNHTLQTNQRHREEEPQNIYSNNTSVRQ